MLHWIDIYVEHIVAFSCQSRLFYYYYLNDIAKFEMFVEASIAIDVVQILLDKYRPNFGLLLPC
jgi:hypothetical protein